MRFAKQLLPLILMLFSLASLGAGEVSYTSIDLQLPGKPVAVRSLFYIYFEIVTAHPREEIRVEGYDQFDFAALYHHPQPLVRNRAEGRYRVRIRYRALKTGRFSIGGIQVFTPDGSYRLNEQVIEIGEYRKGEVKVPVHIEWRVGSLPRHRGEVFPVELFVLDHTSPSLPGGRLEFTGRVLPEIEEVPLREDVVSRMVADKELFSFPVRRFLVSFDKSGERFLPSGGIASDFHLGSFKAKPINIEPLLPDLISDSADSGDGRVSASGYRFEYRYSVDKEPKSVDSPLLVTVTLSGEGNLDRSLIPEPRAAGLSIVSRQKRESAIAGDRGYSGFQSFTWEIRSDSPGRFQVRIPDFHWFDLGSRNYRLIEGAEVPIRFIPHEESVAETQTPEFLIPATLDEVLRDEVKPLYVQAGNYILYLPGFIMLIGAMALVLRRKRVAASLLPAALVLFLTLSSATPVVQPTSAGLEAFEQEDYEGAKVAFLEALELSPENGALCYNAAVSSYRLGSRGDAVFYADRALFYRPGNKNYKKLVEFLERDYELLYQFSPVPAFQPDLFLILSIVLFNLTALFTLLLALVRSQRLLIVAFSFSLLGFAVVSAGFAVDLYARHDRPAVVIAEDQSLLKLHSTDSAPVFSVPAGTMVSVLGEYSDFYIVRTSLGFDGWIKKEYLRLPE